MHEFDEMFEYHDSQLSSATEKRDVKVNQIKVYPIVLVYFIIFFFLAHL